MEIETEKAIYKVKTDFFINIAHEIRTPLSLIKGPYEQISGKSLSPGDYEENIEIMGSNINRLLNLTNQLLDFSKAESCMFTPNLTSNDVGKVIESLLYRFKQAFTQNNLDIKVILPEKPGISLIDDELLTKILSNLINNACKFADKNIIVELCPGTPDNQYYSIKISNDGKLILPENREHIFKAFFQEKNEKFTTGTGLGLSLVKQLIGLLQGKVYIDEKVSGMNCFVIELPLANDKMEYEEDEPVIDKSQSAESVILIVDDDPGMCRFIKSALSENHTVLQAGDGQAASNLLKKEYVDLVVSDVMMPNMDGYELCAYIKGQIRYSHIPVILLTAKYGIDSKIKGLGVGADAYIEKPFSTVFLIEQIKNLLNNRKLLKENFLNNPFIDSMSIATSKIDKEFMERINEVIIRNINNDKLSIDQLATEFGMSRSTLHHKIKAISQLTPNDFILLVRLKEAARLLKDTEFKVNEVCYMVGFKAPSYFAKCFHKQFGVLPKDYHKKE